MEYRTLCRTGLNVSIQEIGGHRKFGYSFDPQVSEYPNSLTRSRFFAKDSPLPLLGDWGRILPERET